MLPRESVSPESQANREGGTRVGKLVVMDMDAKQWLHMVGGEGDDSYASNSQIQRLLRDGAKLIVESAVANVYEATSAKLRMVVADLGCSSGPNTLSTVSEIINTISECSRNSVPPEVQFFLNDLPGNDFNTIFRSIATFRSNNKIECGVSSPPFYICGVPGSFYERLFLEDSVHFVHSSYSLNYLSKVPDLLHNRLGDPSLNKKNIWLAETSPVNVVDAYVSQFKQDFSLFLNLRSKELVCGGRMVLLLLGRQSTDPRKGEYCYFWEALAEALNSMVSEGSIDEADLEGFNLPLYSPCLDEIRDLVLQHEGSFLLENEHILENQILGDFTNGNIAACLHVAKHIRAIIEPVLRTHFTHGVEIDDLFARFAEKIADFPKENNKFVSFVVTLKKI